MPTSSGQAQLLRYGLRGTGKGASVANQHKNEVHLAGRLQTRWWDDKGQNRYTTEIIAWQFVVPGKDQVTKNTHGLEVSDADIGF